ncbi:DUF692 family multinuclear iron-containing protein [Nitrospira sp. NS4]|uniref:multinuclear nonheme iron-dependent oxidase n=1 Tax=Nitrospira sp. NS4 TaxID=3414498 RepID=UPI003C2BFF2F
MNSLHHEYTRRVDQVPVQGLGLSVDVYSPDIVNLLAYLRRRQAFPAYLEVFRAASTALAAVRRHTDLPLTYHGEGLWVTQPGAEREALFQQEASAAAAQLALLHSVWSNHECATKHIAGYSFGTYLPPLYTPASAAVVAANIRAVQAIFDRECRLHGGSSPLFLLEMPPLTYFVAGTVPIPEFFRQVTEQASCGLVLDVGHLWTVYRYSTAWQTVSLTAFLDRFLSEFPLERVVEIHVAGLSVHESMVETPMRSPAERPPGLPVWTDAHAAPIPPVLFEMLDQIVSVPRLPHLKGLALEVDTKPIELIADEYEGFARQYGTLFPGRAQASASLEAIGGERLDAETTSRREAGPEEDSVRRAYEHYARVVSGQVAPAGPEWTSPAACSEGLPWYHTSYLPYEILHWGGEIGAMFPETCRGLAAQQISLETFVAYWFREPRPVESSYDFFEIKIDRFLEFVSEVAPDSRAIARREAEELRAAYRSANEAPLPVAGQQP